MVFRFGLWRFLWCGLPAAFGVCAVVKGLAAWIAAVVTGRSCGGRWAVQGGMGGFEQGGGGGKLLPQEAVLFAAVVRVQLLQFGLYVGEPGLEVGFTQFRHGFEQVAEAVGGGEVLPQEGLVFVVAAVLLSSVL